MILALSAAIGFLAEKDLKIAFGNVIVHYAMLIPIAGMIGTLMFYFMDRYWYHRLLIGSVIHGSSIERRHRFEIPEIGPTVAIADNSPIKLTRRITRWLANLVVTHDAYKEDETLHSTGKIELFYKPIVYLFLLVFVVMLLGRGVTIGQKSIFDITLKNIAAIDSSKAVNPPNAHR